MNPYSELDRVRGSVEELALRKTLPLRQQADKPILKYDTSLSKPVQLFNQPDVSPHRHEGRPPPPSSHATMPSAANSAVTQNGTTKTVPGPGVGTITQNHRKTRGSSIRKMQLSPANGVDNPYSRPLSAKEVIQDVQRSRRMASNGGNGIASGSMVHSHSTSALLNQATDPGIGAASLQLNSFMRPQTTLFPDPPYAGTQAQKKAFRVALGGGDGNIVGGSSGAREKEPTAPQHHPHEDHPKKQTVSYAVASAKSVIPSADPQSTAARVKYGNGTGGSTLGSDSSSRTVVRNPNYTPNKPYSEVCEPHAKDTVAGSDSVNGSYSVKGQPPTGNLNNKLQQAKPHGITTIIRGPPKMPGTGKVERIVIPQGLTGLEDSTLSLHNVTASSLLGTTMGTLRKMPVTHTLTGTLYYKKCFKEASESPEPRSPKVVSEQRPRGDGAPAKVVRGVTEGKNTKERVMSKSVKVVQLEIAPEEDEEEDISTPSGERLPGDGEASCEESTVCDYDEDGNVNGDDEDDGIDDLYDDCGDEDDDGESDNYTICSSASQGSTCTIRLRSAVSRPSTTQSTQSRIGGQGEEISRAIARPVTSSGEAVVQPALRSSLFTAIPPTINFVSEGEKVEQLPWALRKLLKWRMSPITPNIVKHALARIGFRITKKNHDWLGCFGKHMKAQGFKSIREYQKLNHFPGSFQLGRKDRLWRNLSRLQLSFGKKEFGFFPQTFVLPQDLKLLKRAWEDGNSRQKWIIKPPASARGIGIKVINKWHQIPRRRPVIVQRYLSKPLLINGSKFDMRVYVYVTSYDPLRAYVFEDGLARFASCKYSSAMKNLSNKFMHLTNYSINKRNADYQSNTDETVCQGHKWSLKALWMFLKKEGVNTAAVWDSIKDLCVKTLISAESQINSMVKSNVRSRYVVHELFGFDILLDEQYRPWILEVNISPSLHSNSQLDINIKGQMIRDMMNLAGFRLPDKHDLQHQSSSTTTVDMSSHTPSNVYCMDKRLFTNQLAPDERAKHAYFCHRHQDEQVLQTIVDMLTPDDVRILTESIDEDSRKGGFIRVFPTPSTHKYLRYFEAPRYYNLLLDQWVQRYNRMELRGISLLQSLCEEGIHLDSPNEFHRHQWCPPNASSMILSARDNRQQTTQVVKGKDSMLKSSSQVGSRLPRVRAGMSSSSPMGSSSVSQISVGSGSYTPLGPSPVTSQSQVARAVAVPDPNR